MIRVLMKKAFVIPVSLFLFGATAMAAERVGESYSQSSSEAVGAIAATSATSAVAQQQNVTVHGTVSDQFGDPVIGATVVVLGTTVGVATGMDGEYTLQVPVGAVLEFSYMGHVSQQYTITAGQVLNVVLREDSEMLDDVVVIGYGVQRRSVVSAAISSVRGEDLSRITPTRIDQVLRGQVSGVSITQNSGAPNSGVAIRVRGVGTTGNNSPLYIVDGMPVEGGLSNINPADIANIEILKDAASAAVFGARGGNGVIIVTTRRGRSGRPRINYEMTYGIQNEARRLNLLNSEQYMQLMNERAINDNRAAGLYFTQQDFLDLAAGKIPDTNWQDFAFNKNAPITNHQVSVQGGNEKGSYFLSLGRFVHEGILGGNYGASNYDRWTIRANNDYEIFNETSRNFLNRVRIGMNTTYSHANSTGIGNNTIFGSALASALALPPIMAPFLDAKAGEALLEAQPYALVYKGQVLTPSPADFQELRHPLAIYTRPRRTYDNEDKFVGTFWGELDVLPGMVFRSSLGFDLAFWGNWSYRFPDFVSYNSTGNNDPLTTESSAGRAMNRGFTREVQNTLTYNFNIDNAHNFNVLLGQSAREYNTHNISGSGRDLKAYDLNMAIINNALANQATGGRSVSGGKSASAFASYFGRISYDYMERYMIQATIRRDGSYIFGSNNKWGNFPSFSVAWNVWNEPYLQEARPLWFESLKPRFSWGINGNDRIDAWRYMSLMESNLNYYFGDNMSTGISAGRLPNPNIQWEQSIQSNIGVDMTFLRNALTFTFDYFDKRTTNMLRTSADVPGYTGQSAPTVNAGKISNKGVEFDLGYRFSPTRDLSLGIRANASYVKNTIIDYGNATGENSWGADAAAGIQAMLFQRNGLPNPFFYGYRAAGIAQNQAEADAYNAKFGLTGGDRVFPGDVMFKDLNGDGKITAGTPGNPGDREMIGKPIPDWTFGLTFTADYKNFDFLVFFQGVYGVEIYDVTRRSDVAMGNLTADWMDRWHGEGTSNRMPRIVSGVPNDNNWRASDLFIRDGSYLRVKNIQLGYTLPQHLTKIASVERLRVWGGVENLFTFTKYNGFDPEIGDGSGVSRMGNYPQARTVNLGVGITF